MSCLRSSLALSGFGCQCCLGCKTFFDVNTVSDGCNVSTDCVFHVISLPVLFSGIAQFRHECVAVTQSDLFHEHLAAQLRRNILVLMNCASRTPGHFL